MLKRMCRKLKSVIPGWSKAKLRDPDNVGWAPALLRCKNRGDEERGSGAI